MAILGGLLLGQAISTAHQLAGPVISQSLSDFRAAAGWNDIAQGRAIMYRQMYGSTDFRLSDNYEPFRFDLAQAIRCFNQQPWPRADADEALQRSFWRRLKTQLKYTGIDLWPGEQIGLNNPQAGTETREGREWARLIDMSSRAAPLEQTIHDYYRTLGLPNDMRAVDDTELRFQLQRAEYRRKADRDRLLSPLYQWSLLDAKRLRWMGVVDNPGEGRLINAAGVHSSDDGTYYDRLTMRLPPPDALIAWANRRNWDGDLARRYSLDEGFDASPMASFMAKAQGVGVEQNELPGQPAGETDWLKLSYRASRPLPTFAEMRTWQHRLRISDAADGSSVIEGVDPWLSQNTRDILTMQGMPAPLINRLMATVPEPINARTIGMILTPVLEHPNVKRVADQQFGDGVNWVYSALLDSGYSQKSATVLEAAVRQEALDKANAAMIASQKKLEDENRAVTIEQYQIGLIDRPTARTQMIGDQYTEQMATNALRLEDTKFTNKVAAAKIAALREAYMTGHLNPQQIRQQLEAISVIDAMQTAYLDLWQWERTANQRMLTTAEILDTLKKGVLPANQAQQRLVNLGWTGADAMVEIAMVQHELQVTQSKQAAIQASHAATQKATAQKAAQAAAHKQSVAQAAATKAKTKLTHEQALAKHQQLMDQAKYYRDVHMANSAYAAAEAKGDSEKMDAELERNLQDYQRWLVEQQELLNIDPTVASEIGPLQTAQAPGPKPSTSASGASGNPPAPSG